MKGWLIALLALLGSFLVPARLHADPAPGQIVIWNMGWSPTTGVYIRSASANLPPYAVPGWTMSSAASPCRIGGRPVILWWNEAAGLIVPWVLSTEGALVLPVNILPGLTHPLDPQWKFKGCLDVNGDGDDDLLWLYVPTSAGVASYLQQVAFHTLDGEWLCTASVDPATQIAALQCPGESFTGIHRGSAIGEWSPVGQD